MVRLQIEGLLNQRACAEYHINFFILDKTRENGSAPQLPTLAITWPKAALEVRRDPLVAAQVNGIVSCSSRMLDIPKEFSPLLM